MERWANSQRCTVKGWRDCCTLHKSPVHRWTKLRDKQPLTFSHTPYLQKHRKAPKIKPLTPPSLLIAANNWCHDVTAFDDVTVPSACWPLSMWHQRRPTTTSWRSCSNMKPKWVSANQRLFGLIINATVVVAAPHPQHFQKMFQI